MQHHGGMETSHQTILDLAVQRGIIRPRDPTRLQSGLDPFSGSGSTGRGAVLEGFSFVGVELSPEYARIARARIADAARS
jgi:site-specific DNA-methyltransferase (adenine-specific)